MHIIIRRISIENGYIGSIEDGWHYQMKSMEESPQLVLENGVMAPGTSSQLWRTANGHMKKENLRNLEMERETTQDN